MNVNYELLLHKLSTHGVSPALTGWFQSYPIVKAVCKIWIVFLMLMFLCLACPRGPTWDHYCFLYLLMILSCASKIISCCYLPTTQSFLWMSGHLLTVHFCRMMCRVHEWCSSNVLLIHPDKTKVPLMCRRREAILNDYSFGSTTILCVSVACDFGVDFDSNLFFFLLTMSLKLLVQL